MHFILEKITNFLFIYKISDFNFGMNFFASKIKNKIKNFLINSLLTKEI